MFILLTVLPFYANGIHLHTYQEIAGSHVDVKSYPPFTWLGGPSQEVALLASALTPVTSLLLTPVLVIGLALGWDSLRRTERALWLASAGINVATLALT